MGFKDWQIYLTGVLIASMIIFAVSGSGSITGSLLFYIMGIGGIILVTFRFIKSKTKKKESTPIV